MATAASNVVPCIRCEQGIQEKIDTPAEVAVKYSGARTSVAGRQARFSGSKSGLRRVPYKTQS